MSNKKQTAVEWLLSEIQRLPLEHRLEKQHLYMHALKMEREQIVDAVNFGDERGQITTYLTAEQYYNETYGSKGNDKEEQKKLITEIMNEDAKDGLYNTSLQTEISDEEIEAQALTFAKEESYGELNTDLWKGYVFGAKRMRDQLKQL